MSGGPAQAGWSARGWVGSGSSPVRVTRGCCPPRKRGRGLAFSLLVEPVRVVFTEITRSSDFDAPALDRPPCGQVRGRHQEWVNRQPERDGGHRQERGGGAS